jgi:histidinol-phosphate/aromatic aminotransferase/cobyric acid decarboxylase-like protein
MPVMIDFAQALNPYGPHPDVLAAARAAALDRAPEKTSVEARHALAELAGSDPDGIVVGNGASDLLWTCARALVPSGAWLRIAEPTRGEFRAAALACNARVLDWRADARNGFAIQLEALASTRADVLHLANPNSPTGASVPLAEVARMAARVPKTRIILDESFLSLSERADESRTPMPDNVVRIRSLTHDHALPGLRLGYLVCAPPLARVILAARSAGAVSAPVQAAAIAAASHADFVADSRRRLFADRDRLMAELRARGLAPLASSTHFFLLPVEQANAATARLAAAGVLVRDCTAFGLPQHIRIAARPEADCAKLLEAL